MEENREPNRWLKWVPFGFLALVVYFLSIPPLAVLTYLGYFPVFLLKIYISPLTLALHVCPPPIRRWLEAYINVGM